MNEKISVLVPIYNMEAYLNQCLDSLLNQTYINFEVILVNDGSTDDSERICKEYVERDPRFHYFYKENGGVAEARNACLQKATGTYLTFVYPDDWVEKDYLDFLYQKMQESQSDLVMVNHYVLDETQGMFYFYLGEQDYYERAYTSQQLLEDIYDSRFSKSFCFATSWGKLFKRELFEDISFPDGRVGEDGLTMFKIYLKTDRIFYINTAKYAYRRRPGSLSNSWSPQWARDIIYAMEERLALLSSLNYPLEKHAEAYRMIMEDVVSKTKGTAIEASPEYKHIFENNQLLHQLLDGEKEQEPGKALVLAANHAYADQVLTTIKSVCYHNRHMVFYLINSDFPNEWFVQLNKRLKKFNSRIVNCRVTADQIQQYKTDISYTVFLRYFISDFVLENRVIYMDCDMVVTGSLSELYTMDMEGHPIAAVQDYGGRVYYNRYMFNAGFLLIDNAYWKQENMSRQLIDLTNEWHDKVDQADQSILNMRFENNWLALPFDYNHVVIHDHFVENSLSAGQNYPKVIHYLSHRKPWFELAAQTYRDVWWFYHDLDWSEFARNRSLLPLSTSHLYPNGKPLTCLIYTSAVEIEQIEALIQALPAVQFKIAARVFVADGITRLLTYPNVTVYSGIFHLESLDKELQEESDILLDINHFEKTLEMLDYFQEHEKPILAFSNTKQTEHGQWVAENLEDMVAKIQEIGEKNVRSV